MVLLCCSARQVYKGAPGWDPTLLVFDKSGTKSSFLTGVLLCGLVRQALKGSPWLVSYSVAQGTSGAWRASLCCSAVDADVWGEGGYGGNSTPYTWLSSITFLPWLPGFPLQAFPTTITFLMSPRAVFLQSTADLGLGFLYSLYAPAPNWCALYGTCSLSRVCITVARIVCVILIPFRLPQISCFILSLKCFCSDQNSCPDVGIGPLLQFPNPPRAGLVLLTILFFLLIPSSYPVLKVKVTQLCPTLCNPMDYTVHGILQARILEWLAFPFSRGSSQPRDPTQVSCIAGRTTMWFFTSWTTREAQEYWSG